MCGEGTPILSAGHREPEGGGGARIRSSSSLWALQGNPLESKRLWWREGGPRAGGGRLLTRLAGSYRVGRRGESAPQKGLSRAPKASPMYRALCFARSESQRGLYLFFSRTMSQARVKVISSLEPTDRLNFLAHFLQNPANAGRTMHQDSMQKDAERPYGSTRRFK